MSMYRPLRDGWTLTAVSDEVDVAGVPATVPGCVHTDLLAAGLIDDPYLDDNEKRLTWIGRTAWSYTTEFTWRADGAGDRADLVCDGLDTVATVLLNGAEVAATANMHRSYRFPVRHLLREGRNTLEVVFGSPYAYAEERRAELGDLPASYDEPYQFIRKMAANFGWDWGPTLVTSGIWRPVGLHTWSGARLAEVRPLVTVDGGAGRVEVHVSVERAGERDLPLTVTASMAGASAEVRLAPGERDAVLTLTVPEPGLWWPRGYGDQPLYPLTVRLGARAATPEEGARHDGRQPATLAPEADAGALDVWTRRIGFRSLRLDREGGAFAFVVNGVPVFTRGANWIPDDCFPSRVTRERLERRVEQACGANLNLLRVWGGGLYESEDFYDLCDERGLLVWQDFPFACAAYPEEEPFASEVEAEARENVARLAPHPSLVLWNGNNENLEGFADWGWREKLEGRTWGEGFYFGLLPRVVAELDPTRPYWPGSPYSGAPELPPNDPSAGTVHIWDVWNREDYLAYGAYRPRYVAEFGFQGPPAYATLRRALTDDPLTPGSPGMAHHQKAADGSAKLLRGLGDHLPAPAPAAFDDWHYLTQLNQARAVAFGIEHFRSQAPHCMGTVVWQLNDCWPVVSWAAVDGDARRKPLWYALRRVYADRLLVVHDKTVVVVNDGAAEWSGELSVTRRSLDGEPLAEGVFPVAVPARGTVAVPLPEALAVAGERTRELLTVRLGGESALRFYAEDTEVAFPEARFEASAVPVPGGAEVTVTARTVVRELALFPDRLDPAAEVDDMLVTLLPGEAVTFRVRAPEGLDLAALVAYPVLRCVNEPRR
ncbi:glycoside hydrolase family 2 protein [Sphaerisporangium sp. TRM90804]|uniref:glycoside hydrolase family 2 protein n=1 Tax=Sphaerisporangium sp. TRM90804 TaxID=3031113 RepID=UPI00244AE2BA|nr:glycoside hydrolase family 2 protein [Sphaerisporangium sp. TRM90804]MDH2430220.1 glycoside hydrolase family 2 protein [Sphaerisporangium sp. TRM90804]